MRARRAIESSCDAPKLSPERRSGDQTIRVSRSERMPLSSKHPQSRCCSNNGTLFRFLLQTCTSSDTSCEAPDNIQDDRSIKILEMAGVNPDELEY